MKIEVLSQFADIIARETGRPTGPIWSKTADGANVAAIGSLQIERGSKTYGRSWKLSEITNRDGGERVLLYASTAPQLLSLLRAYLDGVYAGWAAAGCGLTH